MEDNIKRPLYAFDNQSNKGKGLKCLALCHGHNHSTEVLCKIKGRCYWYMVDIDKNSYPDYVCDIADKQGMSYFSDNYFDVVLLAFYPIGISDNHFNLSNILQNINRIVKNGRVYLYGIPHTYFLFYNDDEYKLLIDDIMDIMGEEEFINFEKHWRKQFPNKKWTSNHIFTHILHNNYKGIYHDTIKNFTLKKSQAFYTPYLEDHGFVTAIHNNRYIMMYKK